jgi:glucuronate isomerase
MFENKVLPDDRFFSPDARQRDVAIDLYQVVAKLPIVCPHGHVDPRLFADPNYQFGSPVELLLIPDHYVFRMLYSQGITLESLGIRLLDGTPVADDHRKIWQTFADHYYLFRGTPVGVWLQHELVEVFGIDQKLTPANAMIIYDTIDAQLKSPEFRPRKLFERFNIEVLCTTDAATDTLEYHQAIRASGWKGRVIPTFRPDTLIAINTPTWRNTIMTLGMLTNIEISSYKRFIQAFEQRRNFFKELGACATDHGHATPYTGTLTEHESEEILSRALTGKASADDALRFGGHMLMENARMSIEDGLVMQLHVGVFRNHNTDIFKRFGPDKGSDIPIPTEMVNNLRPLLNTYGNDPRLSLILFTMDESSYARECAPLAGHYPALKLGPPWWFNDSLNGMQRYFDLVMESAGLYNTVGFNDDTRAFPSIPARHDVWRRSVCNWLAGLVVRRIIDREDAGVMAVDAAYNLAKKAYKLG